MTYQDIPLTAINPNPRNPRDPKTDDISALTDSVKEKGVIEPIIVRPIKRGRYEIVAGERRFRAALALMKADKAQDTATTIPAIVRKLSDEEAFDFMIIENLQRQNLTEFEEAKSFDEYLKVHGQETADALAERTGLDARYIRRRAAVIKLPDYILKAWRKEKICYGHLEQFLRLKDGARMKALFVDATSTRYRYRTLTVDELREKINAEAPLLSWAKFDLAGCDQCTMNTAVQKELFGLAESKNVLCQDPACFKAKQTDYLTANWEKTNYHKQYKTRGLCFHEDLKDQSYETFYAWPTPPKKCFECDKFLTVLELSGGIRASTACLGPKSCLRSQERKAKSAKEGEKPERPRPAWHGEYFRDRFLVKRIPEILNELDPEDEQTKTLLLICALKENSNARDAVGKTLKLTKGDYRWVEVKHLIAKVLGLPYSERKALFRETVAAIILEGQNLGEWSGFGTINRFSVAKFLGIDLAKEWVITDEYLQKKTISEILALGRKTGIFKEKAAKDYLAITLKKKPGAFDRCKKSELRDLVLKSGVTLTGRVPEEILKEEK